MSKIELKNIDPESYDFVESIHNVNITGNTNIQGDINITGNNFRNGYLENINLRNDQWLYGESASGQRIPLIKIDKYNLINFGSNVYITRFHMPFDARETVLHIPIRSSEYGDTVGFNFDVGGNRMLASKSLADGAGGTTDEYIYLKDVIVQDEIMEIKGIHCDTLITRTFPSEYILEYIVIHNIKNNPIKLKIEVSSQSAHLSTFAIIHPRNNTVLSESVRLFGEKSMALQIASERIGSLWDNTVFDLKLITKRISQ